MYRHTVTLYNEAGGCIAKIKDGVNLKNRGFSEYENTTYLGGPVEAAFTADGKYLWVSNYSMIGPGFENPGCDACIGKDYDPSFLYKINCANYEIESVVKVGSVPKYIAIAPNQKILLVSNWTSSDVSIVDLKTEKEIKKVHVGAHPRGIDITSDSKSAYVTVMGSSKLAEINLETYAVNFIQDIGRSPRHLIISNHDSLLYISMNSGNKLVKYNRHSGSKKVCQTGSGPRSMCINPAGSYIYCVNYFDHTFSKIETKNMTVVEEVHTADKPIGIAANWDESEIWVACYSGKIEVYKDFHLDSLTHGTSIFGVDLSGFWPANHPDEDKNASGNELSILETKTKSLEKPVELKPMLNWSDLRKFEAGDFPKSEPIVDEVMPVVQSNAGCAYHVICGSFSILDNAKKRTEELKLLGYNAEVIVGKELNYVSTSCHVDRESALKAGGDLKSKDGFSSWILKR